MDIHDMHHVPLPRPMSFFLVVLTGGFHWLQTVNHDSVSGYISIITGLCAIVSYLARFTLWAIRNTIVVQKHLKDRKIRKDKSGGKY